MRKFILLILALIMSMSLLGCQESNTYYTMTFTANGGSAVNPVFGQKGTSIREPEVPVKENHTFQGWYFDTDYTDQVVFPYTLTNDLNVYAKWTINELITYTITWIVNDVEYSSTVTHGVLPSYTGPELSKTSTAENNYYFSGWNPVLQPATGDATYIAQFQIGRASCRERV